ncbi:hypothetical protein QN289_03540 [Latilactobacillus curvatus]|uniref:hypothetical protein n=1 Tax=Latilactobacillus curvatus TaxID=28038 RepID=UPI0024DFC399|nr:hypothetical protein [Latilactobacillus curvatus]WIE01442.1 hypothetical protein QN289_03540 [Latilactobacillus curvatus]
MILPNETPIVAYKVMKQSNGFIYSEDSKIYKRKGDAIKRCKRLNELESTGDYQVFGAYGWVSVND